MVLTADQWRQKALAHWVTLSGRIMVMVLFVAAFGWLSVRTSGGSPQYVLYYGMIVLSCLLGLFSLRWIEMVPECRHKKYIGIPLNSLYIGGGTVAVALVAYPWVDHVGRPIQIAFSFLVVIMGILKFSLFVLFLSVLVSWFQNNRINRNMFWFGLMLLLVADLGPSMKVHGFRVINPFYPDPVVFSKPPQPLDSAGNPLHLDLDNYRATNILPYYNIPILKEIWPNQVEQTNIHLLDPKVPLYTGMAQAVSQRYRVFFTHFARRENREIGRFLDFHMRDDRFLDLMGVKYAYDAEISGFRVRDTPFSRFMLFEDVVTLEDDRALAIVSHPDFDIRITAILSRSSGSKSPDQEDSTLQHRPGGNPFIPLAYTQKEPDRLSLEIDHPRPGLILFNDVHHPGWKVTVDGIHKPLEQVDYLFMGVVVPSGHHHIVFQFEPSWAALPKQLFTLAGGLFLLGCLLYGISYSKQKEALIRTWGPDLRTHSGTGGPVHRLPNGLLLLFTLIATLRLMALF